MAKRPTINTVSSGYNSLATLNNNFTEIQGAFDNTLSRDGSTPNVMNADLDMNNNDILNTNIIHANNLVLNGTTVTTVYPTSGGASVSAFVTPYDYGATAGTEFTVDNSVYFQDMIDACTGSWNASANAFALLPFIGGKVWRCDSEITLNGLRQPGFIIHGGGGGIWSKNTNGVALNALNTNQIDIVNFHIYGDATNTPDVGIMYGRVAGGAIAPGVRLYRFYTNGRFNKAAGINLASEVGGHWGCYFQNMSEERTAVAFAWVGHIDSLDNNLTGGSATIQDSLDVGGNSVADTNTGSNLGHEISGCDYKRASPKVITITGITKANPAVVSFASGALASSGWSNGTEVMFHNVAGMTELKTGIYTIANINTGADTFEISGVDSTSFGTFTSGNAWQATGPAVLLNGIANFRSTGYFLSYSEVNHIIDLSVGAPCRGVDINYQGESTNDYACELKLPATTSFLQGGFRWNNLNLSRPVGTAVFKVTGTGAARFDGGFIKLGSLATPYPAGGLFDDPSKISLHNFEIEVPIASILNPAADYAVYNTKETAYDRNPRPREYTETIHYESPTFRVVDGDQITATFESIDTAASTVDSKPPSVDIYRNSEVSANGDAIGNSRFIGNNSATLTTLSVISISKANPAVVTVDSGELTAAAWTNGYKVSFGALSGMDELKSLSFTVANINTGAGTFELSGIDSTSYTTFVSGNVQNTIKVPFSGISGYIEDRTAYAEYGRLLLKAFVNGAETTVGYANKDGLYSLDLPVQTAGSATQTELRAIASTINTVGKFTGKFVWDSTNLRPVWAKGGTAGSVWVDGQGATVHTPI